MDNKKKEKPLLTPEKIWEKKNQFSFEGLLKPYSEGGTVNQPVQRTIGTMVDYFINKKQYPIDVVGAAILMTFMEMKDGLQFKGDGEYGSKGRELVTYIRKRCDIVLHERLQSAVYQSIAEQRMPFIRALIDELTTLKIYPRWKKIVCFRKWKKLKQQFADRYGVHNEPA